MSVRSNSGAWTLVGVIAVAGPAYSQSAPAPVAATVTPGDVVKLNAITGDDISTFIYEVRLKFPITHKDKAGAETFRVTVPIPREGPGGDPNFILGHRYVFLPTISGFTGNCYCNVAITNLNFFVETAGLLRPTFDVVFGSDAAPYAINSFLIQLSYVNH